MSDPASSRTRQRSPGFRWGAAPGRPLLPPLLLVASALVGSGGAPGEGADPREPFVERAAELGLDFVHFNGMSGELYFVEHMGAGAALFDYDGDGDLDVFLTQGAMLGEGKGLGDAVFPPAAAMLPLTDRLYRNDLVRLPDGTVEPRFVDVTARAGFVPGGYAQGVATGDYDGDGWIDLYVTGFGPNRLYRNQGDGSFADQTAASGTQDLRWSMPAVFFDYDRDGHLDLYVGHYVDFSLATHASCVSPTGRPDYCGPLSYRPLGDRLFRNRGDGTFEDVSLTSGIGRLPGATLGAIAGDFDDDGWPDLYVANDQEANFLWLNRRDGTFVEDAALAGCAVNATGQPEASMGVDAVDFDGDGDEELILSHLDRETNTLYVRDGPGQFYDGTLASGLGAPSWPYTGFGIGGLDYDSDGWPDVLVVNGAVRLGEEPVEPGSTQPLSQRNQLFHALGSGRFAEITAPGPAFAPVEVSRAAAFGDLDGDGDVDVLIGNNAGPVRLLLNQAGAGRGWLVVAPVGGGPAQPVLGARVEVAAETGSTQEPSEVPNQARLQVRWTRSAYSYLAANDPRVHFGLGASQEARRLRIAWPDGHRQELRGVRQGVFAVVPRSR
jgi:enediyne biosynthesis protein E4